MIYAYQWNDFQLMVDVRPRNSAAFGILVDHLSQEEVVERLMGMGYTEFTFQSVIDVSPEVYDLLEPAYRRRNCSLD